MNGLFAELCIFGVGDDEARGIKKKYSDYHEFGSVLAAVAESEAANDEDDEPLPPYNGPKHPTLFD